MEIRYKILTPRAPPFKVTQVKTIGTATDRLATYDFLLVIRNNHGPISYHFRDKIDICKNSPTPCIKRLGSKARQSKKCDAMCIRLDTVLALNRRTELPIQYRASVTLCMHALLSSMVGNVRTVACYVLQCAKKVRYTSRKWPRRVDGYVLQFANEVRYTFRKWPS